MRSAGRVNSKVEELERWLAELQLPVEERLTLEGCLRQIDFLDGEIGALEARRVPTAVGSPATPVAVPWTRHTWSRRSPA